MRVASEVLDIITKPFFDKNSAILLNAGLHYLESTNFSNYQKTIASIIRLFDETRMVRRANGKPLFLGEMIWRTTTALNKQKLDGKHIQARRFLTYQVWSVSQLLPGVPDNEFYLRQECIVLCFMFCLIVLWPLFKEVLLEINTVLSVCSP